jgi:hypothetical protein
MLGGTEDLTWSLEKKKRVEDKWTQMHTRTRIEDTTTLSNKNAFEACEKKRIHIMQRK